MTIQPNGLISGLMWFRYLQYKNLLTSVIGLASLVVICLSPKDSVQQWIAISALGLPGIAYVIEETVWISKRDGRPCNHCGQAIHFKPFRVVTNCPRCHKSLG